MDGYLEVSREKSTPSIFQWKKWKRQLFLWHRWAGIFLCLFFAAWFISGIFMMYVEFPQLTRQEQLAGSAALDFSSATLSPASAVRKLTTSDFATQGTPSKNIQHVVEKAEAITEPASVRLGMLLERPVYFVQLNRTMQPRAVFADNGEVLSDVSTEFAHEVVSAFVVQQNAAGDEESAIYKKTYQNIRYEGRVQTDQWTVSSALNPHRPLLHFSLDDQKGSEFYVSSTTGEVVRDTHSSERWLNYFGAVTHWIYPTILRQYPDFWAWIVDILSAAGAILALSGLWIGWLRWKRNPRPGKQSVPYRGLMRWHYFTGISFGLVTLTWVFSGLLSMNPGSFNPSRSPSPQEKAVFTGVEQSLRINDFSQTVPKFSQDTVTAELVHYQGEAYYLTTTRHGIDEKISLQGKVEPSPALQELERLSTVLMPTESVASIDVLNKYDNYYFSRRPENGGKPLPVLRIKFNDSASTWFYVDMATGRLLERSTTTNRVYRWLYNGLHSWDIRWLWERRPLWDIAVITFSLGGLLLSIIGMMVGWKRLRA